MSEILHSVWIWSEIIVAGLILLQLTIHLLTHWWDFQRSLELVFLRVLIPKKDSKEDKQGDSEHEQFGSSKEFRKITGIMVHLLENLQAMFARKFVNRFIGQDFFSLEYAVLDGQLYFFVVAPRKFKQMLEKQITGFYKDAVIDQVSDYNIFHKGNRSGGVALVLAKSYAQPLNTFQKLENESINPIVNAFSKINPDEGAAIQIMLRPVRAGWRKKCRELADALYTRKHISHSPFGFLGNLFGILIHGPKNEYLASNSEGGMKRK